MLINIIKITSNDMCLYFDINKNLSYKNFYWNFIFLKYKNINSKAKHHFYYKLSTIKINNIILYFNVKNIKIKYISL